MTLVSPVVPFPADVSAKVKDSWKFAAVEIYNLINQVRENGLDDVHEMESKMRELLASMNQQSEIIDKLSNDLQHQRQVTYPHTVNHQQLIFPLLVIHPFPHACTHLSITK